MGTHSRRRLTADERARLEAERLKGDNQHSTVSQHKQALIALAETIANKAAKEAAEEYSARLEQRRRDEQSRILEDLRRRYGMSNQGR